MIDYAPIGSYPNMSLKTYLKTFSAVVLIIPHYCPFGDVESSIFSIVNDAVSKRLAVFFCSTNLSKSNLEKLIEIGIYVYIKEIGGRDFGAIKHVYSQIAPIMRILSTYNRVLILNNSMISLGKIDLSSPGLAYLLASNADFCGITDSIQSRSYHIQSYHFSMSDELFLSQHISRFFLGFDHHSLDRDYIITNGELLLSKLVIQSGYRISVFNPFAVCLEPDLYVSLSSFIDFLAGFFPSSTSWTNSLNLIIEQNMLQSITSNPTHYRWLILILKGHYFVKRELLEKNPENICIWPYLMPLVSYLGLNINESDLMSIGPKLRL